MDAARLLDGRLKIRHLVLVTTIADTGGIVRAAESLHVTQPVVTRALREVEDILGVPLFERHGRGVTPTIFGESFIGTARAIIAHLRHSAAQLTLLSTAQLGTVTIGTHLAGSNLLVPRAITALKGKHPAVTVVVREATPDRLQALLLDGEIDMVVGRLRPGIDQRLHAEQLCHEPIVLVARQGHPVHGNTAPTLEELAAYPWIFPLPQTALRRELEELFLTQGVEVPANRVECTSMVTLRHLLVTSDVLAVLPMSVAAEDDKLAVVGAPFSKIGRSVGVTVVRDLPLSPSAVALLECLRREGRRLAAGT